MSDATLILEENGGDLILEGGDLLVGNGLEGAAIISLFGGNMDDNGLPGDNGKQYWGNLITNSPTERQRAETQRLLRTIPATSGNLLRLQDAVVRDLAWFTVEKIVEKYAVEVRLIAVRRITIVIDLLIANNENQRLQFTREWTGKK